jgi:hypothetical protein
MELLRGIVNLLMYSMCLPFRFGVTLNSSKHDIRLAHGNMGHVNTLLL